MIQQSGQDFKLKYKLVDASVPLLNNPLEDFDFADPPMDPVELAQDLVAHMNHFSGIGLSANQLGLPYKCFVMVGEPVYAVFNPKITAASDDMVMMDEGCLSYPGLYVKVKRPSAIRVRFQDPYGDLVVKKFNGMTARVFQHEYEHMMGERFTDTLSQFALNRARDKQKKILNKVRKQLKNANKQVNKRR
jgi:peptide deformylase